MTETPAQAGPPTGLWLTWAAGPLAWAIHQNVSYASVEWVCATGGALLLHLVSLGTLALAAAGFAVAWRGARRPLPAQGKDAGASAASRRFLAICGMGICALSLGGIVVESIPNFVLDPCTGAA